MIDRARIISLLPEFWHGALERTGAPASALIDVMEGMLAPAEARIAALDAVLDPHRCPAEMLPFLAVMNGFAPLLPHCRGDGSLTEAGLRALLIAAPELSARRGQAHAVITALELVTGIRPELDEAPEGSEGFHVVLRFPAAARPMRRLIDATTRLMRPAHVTHALDFGELDEAARLTPQAPLLPEHLE